MPYALLWAVSGVRVVGVVLLHQTVGVEATLAMLVVALLPVLLRDSLRAHFARFVRKIRRRQGTRDETGATWS